MIAVSGATVLAGTVVPAALSTAPARADSVVTLQQRAATIAGEIQTNYDKLDVLAEGYNQAHAKVVQLAAEVATTSKAIAGAERTLRRDQRHLRSVAIEAYVNSSSTSPLVSLLTTSQAKAPMQQAYVQAASGNLTSAEASVKTAAHALAGRRSALRNDQRAAKAAQARIVQERHLAQQLTNQLEGELASVKGRLAQAVAQAEQQKALQQLAAARAAALAQQQVISVVQSAAPAALPTVSGGGSGAAAVRAAESQLGVPYQWGGATPGQGFDCSGLTMWSWGQAGVSLSHGATDQYHETTPVSMSSLQPGDLVFYGSPSYAYHVVMYVGSGPYGSSTVIQAEHSGTNVMFTPLPGGAFGAGRP